VPAELLKICAQIDTKLANLGAERLYSADFGLTPDGWKLFEVNAMPGTINRARGEQALYYQDKLTDFLRSAAKAGQANSAKERAS
jgi:glutathione synthase/RimK-type ligase-like ATP-grasp enzyme